MNVLFITARLPYPPLKGDQAVPWHRLRLLSKQHEVTLLSFYQSENQLKHLDRLQEHCKEVHLVKLGVPSSLLSVALRMGVSPLPMQVLYYKSRRFQRKLLDLLSTKDFDLVHAFMLRIGPYVSDIKLPKVLELNDAMQLNLQRRLSRGNWLLRTLIREELRRVAPFERGIGDHVDELIVTSQKDREFIGTENVSVVPLGVDTASFFPKPCRSSAQRIIFTGNMAYPPNIEAVAWFVEHCFPLVRAELPRASLVIAGANPHKRVRELGKKPGIHVRGFVESMSDALNMANVAVAPMQSGSGMQFKILEAMACALPVVTTTVGLGDIKALPGEEILISDTALDFAEHVKALLLDDGLCAKIGHRAVDFVRRNHSWSSAAARLQCIYDELACASKSLKSLMLSEDATALKNVPSFVSN